MPDGINNVEPSIALLPVIQVEGDFPARESGGGYISNILAQIRFYATSYLGSSDTVVAADGAILPIASNTALFSLLGTTFGGNGQTTFALPDLDGRIVTGSSDTFGHFLGDSYGSDLISLTQTQLLPTSGGISQPFENVQSAITVGWYINVEGIYPVPDGSGGPQMIGAVNLFAGNFAPNGTLPCDGRLLPILQYEALFTIIGTTYGGDGETTFALPDLRGRTPVGVGQGPGLDNYTLGELVGVEEATLLLSQLPAPMGGSSFPVGNRGPGLVMTPLIALQGLFTGVDSEFATLGEVSWFAGSFAPRGYAIAQGQLLSINQNQALFSLLGTTYGGNGQTNFALPDLRGRVVVGAGDTYSMGTTAGTTSFTVGAANIPPLVITGDPGDNTYYGSEWSDSIEGGNGNDTLYGNGGGDILLGGLDNDTLDGGTGADQMWGGAGDDTYRVDSTLDIVTENPLEGLDLVITALSNYTLPANVENLTGTSTLGQTLTGNSLNNEILGGIGNDLVIGDGGNDVLKGGAGDDKYLVGTSGTQVVELSGEGTDRIIAWTDITLPDHVENLQFIGVGGRTGTGNALDNAFTGSAGIDNFSGLGGVDRISGGGGNDTLNGGSGNDIIWGGLGNDTIDGGTEADTMVGGQGDDIIYVDDAGDLVVEAPGEGTDEIRTTLASYTLSATLENLTGLSNSGQSLTGNGAANVIRGGDGNDVIFGAAGDDTMLGGLGDDTYWVQNAGDTVAEQAGQGTDKVQVTVDYTQPVNVEIMQLLVGGLTVSGNSDDNTIRGSAGIDTISGLDGADRINGAASNDVIDGGASDDFLWGDKGDDVLVGGTGSDRLFGGDDADTLRGGGDRDFLTGEAGTDTFAFAEGDTSASRADGDVIVDFSSIEGDRIDLQAIDANTTAGQDGDQAFTFIGALPFTGSAGQLRFEVSGLQTFVEGDVNGDSLVDFSIRLYGVHALLPTDFVL